MSEHNYKEWAERVRRMIAEADLTELGARMGNFEPMTNGEFVTELKLRIELAAKAFGKSEMFVAGLRYVTGIADALLGDIEVLDDAQPTAGRAPTGEEGE